jgi:hypothetical protein
VSFHIRATPPSFRVRRAAANPKSITTISAEVAPENFP